MAAAASIVSRWHTLGLNVRAKTLYYVIDIDQFHAPNAKLKIRQYLILPDFRQNRQIFCTPIFLRLR